MKFFDRLLTIVVTATLTSLAWIVFGGTLMEMAGDRNAATTSPDDSMPEQDTPEASEPATTAGPESGSRSAQSGNEALRIPVQGVAPSQLRDTFLDSRGQDGVRRHEAIDIAAPRGTPVIAAARGTVAKLFQSDAGGKTIYVRSPDRKILHYYAHLDRYAPDLREGQDVRAGQTLGTVGSSGNASEDAPHLHFAIMETTADAEWWEPANAINPYPLLRSKAD